MDTEIRLTENTLEKRIENSKENIEKYIDSNNHDSRFIASIIREITRIPDNKTFKDKTNINIVVFEDKDNRIEMKKNILPFDFNRDDNYILIYEKEEKYELIMLKKRKDDLSSMIYSKRGEEDANGSEKMKNGVMEDFMILEYSNNLKIKEKSVVFIPENNIVGYIHEINGENDSYKLRFYDKKFKDDKPSLSKEDFLLTSLDNLIIDKLIEHSEKKMIIGDSEFPDYETIKTFMTSYTFTKNYYDITKRITHVGYKKGGNEYCIPIKPIQFINGIESISNKEMPEIKYDLIIEVFKTIDKKIDDSKFIKYIENHKKTDGYIIFNNASFIKIEEKEGDNYNNLVHLDELFLKNKKDKKDEEDERETFIKKHFNEREEKDKTNILLIMYIRRFKNKKTEINKILNNEIMLHIDKRKKIYEILKKCKEIKNKKDIYEFIELLLINGYDNLYYILINNITLKDITKETIVEDECTECVFKYFQIINKEYKSLFNKEGKNDYIRQNVISYECSF